MRWKTASNSVLIGVKVPAGRESIGRGICAKELDLINASAIQARCVIPHHGNTYSETCWIQLHHDMDDFRVVGGSGGDIWPRNNRVGSISAEHKTSLRSVSPCLFGMPGSLKEIEESVR
jgi:hypothetical protein